MDDQAHDVFQRRNLLFKTVEYAGAGAIASVAGMAIADVWFHAVVNGKLPEGGKAFQRDAFRAALAGGAISGFLGYKETTYHNREADRLQQSDRRRR